MNPIPTPSPLLLEIGKLLSDLKLSYQFDETATNICTVLGIEDTICPIIITPVVDGNNSWLYLSTWGLSELPLMDDGALCEFYKALLKANNYTKLGKFYINEANHLEFSVDIRLQDLSEDLLAEALDLILYVVHEKLPAIANPYTQYLFKINS